MAVYNSSRVGQLNDIHLLKYLYVFFLCRLLPGVDIIFSRDNIILQSESLSCFLIVIQTYYVVTERITVTVVVYTFKRGLL